MYINIYSSFVWLAAIIIGSLDLVIFLGSKRVSSRAFAHSIFWVTIWVASIGIFISITSPKEAIFFSRMTYFLGSVIATTFLYFFLTYPSDNEPKKYVSWLLFIFQTFFAYLFLFTDKIIYSVSAIQAPHPWAWHFGSLSFLFEIFFFGFFGLGIVILYKKYKNCTDLNTKANLKYMLWVIIVGATPPSIMCIIMPRFGYYDLNWLGPITEIIWIPIISYSIIRYRQMDVKAVAAEVLAIAMSIILFINIFVDISSDPWSGVITFVAFIILAYYLIKNILREAKQAEQLKDLNDNLERKVAEQTTEIRKSYDLEKKARRELEKLNETKDQFIMITQHHLRTPVTGLRWELESILAGDHGRLSPSVKESLSEAQTSVARLTRIVDDFLSITALKAGSNILNLSQTSLKPILSDILHELRIDIESKKLTINQPAESQEWPVLNIDSSKVREALLIIIENAVRYNNDGGSINIEAIKDEKWFTITVTDTGVGVKDEDKEKIFNNLFHRGEKARQLNPIGMGVGLSVARAIIRAHHGELELSSDGEWRGTKVVVRMPVTLHT